MNISPQTKKVQALFHGLDLQYRVPRYQRDYAWTKDQVEQLWSDLLSAFQSSQDYFLGSVVVMTDGDGGEQKVFSIVDGQQRLTTITILLCAIRDLSHHYSQYPSAGWYRAVEDSQSNRDDAAKSLAHARQAIVLSGEPDHYYLTINQKDQALFRDKIQKQQSLVEPQAIEMMIRNNESRLTKAWKLLLRRIHEELLCAADGMTRLRNFVHFCLTKVFFLVIEVRDDVDAYLLFESLNDRGLELSIADLVKNRLMIVASPDQEKVERVVGAWEAMLSDLAPSRFAIKDYLRFYWSAFKDSCTAKQLYSNIKRHLDADNVENELAGWREAVDYFIRLTAREQSFPNAAHAYNSLESLHAQMATLKYSVCLPFLMAVHKLRPDLDLIAARLSLAYLFRVVTIADLSAGKADATFKACLQALKNSLPNDEVLRPLREAQEASEEEFVKNITDRTFEDNAIARYLLTCIHLHDIGGGSTPDTTIELEHILPQNEAAWPGFDAHGRKKTDWIYSIGNATLLEEKVNASIRDAEFSHKVTRYRRRQDSEQFSSATAIPMTYELFDQYQEERESGPRREWTAERIRERAVRFARKAAIVFSLTNNDGGVSAGGAASTRGGRRRRSSS
jgi:hypothetical protein